MRYMYDAVTLSNVTAADPTPQLIACYADGTYQNLAEAKSRFPHAIIVPIAVRASYTGSECRVLDVETGDATPAEAVGWVKAMRAKGVDPTVYCNTSTWPAVKSAFASAGVTPPHYWVAEYDGVAVVPAGAVAKQYLGDYHGYDKSAVADYWPGVDPKPVPVPPPPPPAPTPLTGVVVLVNGSLVLTQTGTLRSVSTACAAAYRHLGIPEKTLTSAEVAAIQGGLE